MYTHEIYPGAARLQITHTYYDKTLSGLVIPKMLGFMTFRYQAALPPKGLLLPQTYEFSAEEYRPPEGLPHQVIEAQSLDLFEQFGIEQLYPVIISKGNVIDFTLIVAANSNDRDVLTPKATELEIGAMKAVAESINNQLGRRYIPQADPDMSGTGMYL